MVLGAISIRGGDGQQIRNKKAAGDGP